MPEIHVGEEIIGKRLEKPVYSAFGGLLYPQGHQLREKDVEFLLAFKIENVFAEMESAPSPVPEESLSESNARLFKKAMMEMERAFIQVMAGGTLPLLEIRSWLKPLLERFDSSTGWLFSFQENSITNYRAHHALGTALIAVGIARGSKIPEREWMQIALAGLLSNIGMVKISPSILQKKGPLTKEEWSEVYRHPIVGYEILKNVKGLTDGVLKAVLQHHERIDGKGYPLGLTAEKIHPYAKIVAIADVLHAVASNRSYREAQSPYRFLEEMRLNMTHQFDAGYIHGLMQSLLQLPLGTPVLLNDGRVAKILYFNPTSPLRPLVGVGGRTISLLDRKELSIDKILIES